MDLNTLQADPFLLVKPYVEVQLMSPSHVGRYSVLLHAVIAGNHARTLNVRVQVLSNHAFSRRPTFTHLLSFETLGLGFRVP